MSLYQEKWVPRGARKVWKKTSLTNSSAEQALSGWINGHIIDVCGWFDEHDNLRILVADTDAGRRVTYRAGKRGFTIQMEPRP